MESAKLLLKNNLVWFILIFLSITWGSSFILMKKGLESFSAIEVASLRIFAAFVFFVPFAVSRIKYVKKKHIKSLLIVGFIGNAIPAILFTKAQTHVSSAMAGMLNGLTPFFVFIVGLIFYKSTTRWFNALGIFIGLIGAGLLVGLNSKGGIHGELFFVLLIVLATLFYGFNTNEIKNNLSDLDGITIASIAFLFIGPLAAVILFSQGFANHLHTSEQFINFFYIIILALFSSVLAAVAFNLFIKRTNAIIASSVTYLIPIVSTFWGISDGETVTISQVLCISVILFGVWLVNKKDIQKKSETVTVIQKKDN